MTILHEIHNDLIADKYFQQQKITRIDQPERSTLQSDWKPTDLQDTKWKLMLKVSPFTSRKDYLLSRDVFLVRILIGAFSHLQGHQLRYFYNRIL